MKWFLMMFVFLSHSVLAEVNIGTVNIQQVLMTIEEGKDVRGRLEKTFNDKKAELKKEEDELLKLREGFEKQKALLSESEQGKKQQDLMERWNGIRKKTEDYQNEIRDMEQQLKKPILDRLQTLVEEISKKEAVDFTVELSSSPLVYVKSRKDITEQVIAEYNKKFPVKKKK